ncbi:CAP domain-containing protein [Candidatus Woesebacteria bacterium]|nr:CAP domain-containing protein [Candidatus Woesebacteria bacterium]QQG47009.1 MAG: CAP domain-containing protein [Candidatus Woesebacteria bacterium]
MELAATLSHFFIPRESNNQKARLLHPSFLTVFLIGIIIYQYAINLISFPPLRILGYASNISTQEVIKLTNVKREEAGLSDVSENPLLDQAAQEKAKDMVTKGYWAHVAPDGTQPWKFFADVDYKYRYAGENLARDFKDPASAVDAWMASPSHRDNMLSGHYKDIGVAVIDGQIDGRDTTIIVQLFGTTLSEYAQATPVKAAETKKPEVATAPTPTLPPLPQIANTKAITQSYQISPFDATRAAAIGLSALFITLFILDLIIVKRRNIVRLSGRTFAHLSFFGMIIAILLVAKAGNIL